ncbi:MAG: hypothetical protein JO261_07515 [Alphaproteobacteria bacterium]|nr:hypothetical protein [Alphaproteobacteria bacterium]MBV9693530.1 hypothetical protein [Alphaproteobacteria bacterium]
MRYTEEEFRQKYLAAAHQLGLAAPSDATILEDYRAYNYGTKLIVGESSIRFFKDGNRLDWDVGPAS